MNITIIFIYVIAVIIIVLSLYILYSSNNDCNENNGILGILVGLLLGYIGIIKNKQDIYEVETGQYETSINLDGNRIIISKFNEVKDTLNKIFPTKDEINVIQTNPKPAILEENHDQESTIKEELKQQTARHNAKIMELLHKGKLRNNDKLSNNGNNGNRQLVDLFSKFETAEITPISRTALSFPNRSDDDK
jgi:hypothetical protein